MSFIGATGYNENQEELDTLKDNIDANASYINNLVGIPDPLHTAIFGINLLNPGLFGLVERAEVNIKALQTGLEGEGTTISGIETTISGIETTISGIETEVSGIQTEILGIQGEITGIDSTISSIEFVQLPALGTALTALIGATDVIAVDARNKANRALDIWDYSGDNTYNKKTGNVGIGTTFGSVLTNKLEVNGNINIPTGSTFRINNVNFGYSNLDHKLLAGTNINIDNDYKINNTYTYTLPTAGVGAGGALGGVKVDGSTITITNGIISGANTYTLPTAGVGTGGTLGGVKVDGTTINITNGVISSTAGLPATIRLTPTPTDGFYSWINSQALLAKTPSTGVLYSSGSADGDIVLRSDTDKALILQSGIGDPAITLTAGLNRVRIHQRVGINTLPNTNYWLDVNGSINATQIRVGGNVGSADNILEVGSILKIASNSGTERLTITSTGVQVNHTLNVSSGLNAGGLIRLGGFADDSSFDLAIIQNREYVANKSELLLFKGDNIQNTNGVDRIRLRSGAIAFDTYSTDLTTSAITENIRMYIDGVGNVGIGTTNPNFNLHLHKTATAQDLRIQITDGTTTTGVSRGVQIIKGTDNQGYLYNFENNSLVLGTNATERMRILANGNIGIGISPNYKLDVNGDVYVGNNSYYLSDHTGTASSQFFGKKYTTTILGGMEIENTTLGGNYSQKLHFHTHRYAGTYGRRMTIDEVGDVSMTGSLTASGYVSATNYIIANTGAVYARRGFDVLLYADGGGMMLCMGNIGDVSTGGGSPAYLRFGAYAGGTYMESNSNRTIVFKIWSGALTGTQRAWEFNQNGGSYNNFNTIGWQQASDHRIKENIVKADLKTCYDNVKNINLYRFNYIDSFQTSKQDKNKLGYIAQEVKRHFPKAVIIKKERLTDKREIPDLLTIDTEQINVSLYGAVKQLIKIVEKQNKRIKTLETLLNIDDNDDVENDAGEAYERIHDEEQIDIDTIEPTEPPQDKAPMGVSSPSDEGVEEIEEINVD